MGIDAQHTARQHRQIEQRYRIERHVAAVAKAQAGCRALGNLMLVGFVVLACLMASYTLHAEQQQQRQFTEHVK